MRDEVLFMLIRLMSRKFILCVLSLISAHYLVINNHITDQVYSGVLMATIAVYVAGNVTQKFKKDS
jgi:hypothetical protein